MKVYETTIVYWTLYDTDELDSEAFLKSFVEDAYIVDGDCCLIEDPESHVEWHDMVHHWISWGKQDLLMEAML